MTKTIAISFTTLRSSALRFKKDLRNNIDRKIENALVTAVHWVISKRSVQKVIAEQFQSQTPLCHVLEMAIENYRGEIDADDISGLDKAIEGSIEMAMRDLEIEANQITDFDRAVKEVIDDHRSDLANDTIEELIERLRK